jgi:hypothetical protein
MHILFSGSNINFRIEIRICNIEISIFRFEQQCLKSKYWFLDSNKMF